MIPEEVNARRGRGIPTARNVDHFAVTVPDLEQGVEFFVRVLGAALLYVEGPIAGGAWMVENLGVDAGATCRVAMLRLGPSTNLELFEYEAAGQRAAPPRNSDVGGHHLAIYVDDIDAAYRYLASTGGVRCQGVPKTIETGPIAGGRWLYFTTPWGMQLEVISPARPSPYEAATRQRRAGPHAGGWDDGYA